ncbi:MAG TPA: aminotransferase class I/II-fold pyridoxal phosphate-dependent enzyme [Devosia sp.]|nr:aminotransferase class I/II-fold pyridoxal phosphate-dependent enzyme [Devosia sp.]
MTTDSRPGVEPFHGLEINALARRLEAEGRDIAFLEQGQPAAPPAPRVIEAVRARLDGPQMYTHFAGLPALREALAAYYAQHHGVAVRPDSIIATMGSSSAFILAFLAAFPPGAKIAVTRPGYTAYLNTLYGMGYRPVEIALDAEHGWHLDAAAIEAAHAREPFAGLLLASPANPTGAALTREQLAAIIAACRRLGVRFISDEIYHGLDYRGPSVSALELAQDAIVINSFSKYYCMTGWRIGWMVLPEDLLRRTQILQQNLFIAAPTLSQIAATAALAERDYCEAQKQHYAKNRPLLTSGLRALGFGVDEGDGAFYAYADASRFTNDSLGFCQRMLEEAGVAASPGVDFDRVNGRRFVRFSYAGSRQTMEKALERLAKFLPR